MKILIRLTGYSWRHKWHLLGAVITSTLATLSAMIVPQLLQRGIDQALHSGIRTELLIIGGLILLTSALRGVFAYGQQYLTEAVSQRGAFDLRNDIFAKLQMLSFGFHDHEQTGDLMSKATADVEAVRRFMSMGLLRSLTIGMTLMAVSSILLATNWRLGLICLAFVPPLLWRALHLSRILRPTWMKVQAETGQMTRVLQENITGIRVVKAFGGASHEETKFESRASSVARLTYSAMVLFASQGALMTLIMTIATAAILWVGGREVVNERLSIGELVAFIYYMGMLRMPIGSIGWLINSFTRAGSAGQRIFDVLDSESPVTEKPDASVLPRVKGHVRFENVALNYGAGEDAVKDIDFEVKPGQTIAVLGGPGSGKSTIVHLIPRFYDVSAGRLSIDNTDVRDVTLESLRRNVGIVLQDVFLFSATFRDNIAYGADNSSPEDIERVARVAQMHDFISELPRGYDSWVGERGYTLSGGQRQRLAIARTLLLDPPVLILDDSTSSVDVGTEYQIQQALSELIKGRTTFVIAHRLSTVRAADLILVLDKGHIVERGTHDELIDQDGVYKRIHDIQLKPQEEQTALADPTAITGGDA